MMAVKIYNHMEDFLKKVIIKISMQNYLGYLFSDYKISKICLCQEIGRNIRIPKTFVSERRLGICFL